MIWLLLVIMQLKHFIADYPLQGPYMLGKFKDKGWVLPLAAHCGVHFLFTFFISLGSFIFTDNISPMYFWLSVLFGLVDFSIHFIMDRIKASPKMLGRYQALSKNEMMQIIKEKRLVISDNGKRKEITDIQPLLKSNVLFWWSLGIDQMVHHLTDILVVALIMSFL